MILGEESGSTAGVSKFNLHLQQRFTLVLQSTIRYAIDSIDININHRRIHI